MSDTRRNPYAAARDSASATRVVRAGRGRGAYSRKGRRQRDEEA